MANTSTGRVLIVEDNEAMRESLRELLEDSGYDVTCVEHGQAALDHLRTGQLPDLFIVDLVMPVMDGWEFLRRLKETPTLADIPVVVVSAMAEGRGRSLNTAPVVWFGKPFLAEDLLRTIHAFTALPEMANNTPEDTGSPA